jgi:hypothetical protein
LALSNLAAACPKPPNPKIPIFNVIKFNKCEWEIPSPLCSQNGLWENEIENNLSIILSVVAPSDYRDAEIGSPKMVRMCGAKRRTSLHPKSFPLQHHPEISEFGEVAVE